MNPELTSESRLSWSVPAKLAIDLVSAGAASLLVSPFVTILDRAIIENATGKRRLSCALKAITGDFVRNPFAFVRRREFALVYGLYAATYVSANTMETMCDAANVESAMPRFAATSAVNVSLCVYKDREFARMFSPVGPHKFPLTSLGLFAMRDAMTVAATFFTPPEIAAFIESSGYSKSTSSQAAQILFPSLVQFASTPLHLLSLDLYNHPQSMSTKRIAFVRTEYLKTVAGRISRILPAFGFGSVGNKYFREEMRTAANL
ncbi:Aste57867_2859 [Aphanomyces stellatus]|uniref:Aste57867_2859 protein n=1 Tax=Aphanomyces stellatus TaxID=120398 RepID=A0A485K8G6_9STRA|nr:hypothetical protein As57867_002851 [Aphanomyces stellatus]VFT80046.1 Aste57867_2859 [Aphanomyces stellatus]